MTQKMMAALYGVSKQTISQHIQRIYDDGELLPEATVKNFLNYLLHFAANYAKIKKVKGDAPLAQLDRASGYGPEGRGFESLTACQNSGEIG